MGITDKYGIPLEKGIRVFNGDMGVVREINFFAEQMTVEFDEGRKITYPFAHWTNWNSPTLSPYINPQGSEYPAVVMPLLTGRGCSSTETSFLPLLPGQKSVAIVGSEQAVAQMIRNQREQKRYSGLSVWLNEV